MNQIPSSWNKWSWKDKLTTTWKSNCNYLSSVSDVSCCYYYSYFLLEYVYIEFICYLIHVDWSKSRPSSKSVLKTLGKNPIRVNHFWVNMTAFRNSNSTPLNLGRNIWNILSLITTSFQVDQKSFWTSQKKWVNRPKLFTWWFQENSSKSRLKMREKEWKLNC